MEQSVRQHIEISEDTYVAVDKVVRATYFERTEASRYAEGIGGYVTVLLDTRPPHEGDYFLDKDFDKARSKFEHFIARLTGFTS